MKITLQSPSMNVTLSPVERPLVVGRQEGSDVRVDDRSVSRRHAEFSFRDGAWFVKDLDSRYGTFVSGRQIKEAPARIDSGSRVQFGHIVFSVQVETPPVPLSATAPAIEAHLPPLPAVQVSVPPPTPVADATKKCPFCAETIKAEAILCRFCNRDLVPARPEIAPPPARPAPPDRGAAETGPIRGTPPPPLDAPDRATARVRRTVVAVEPTPPWTAMSIAAGVLAVITFLIIFFGRSGEPKAPPPKPPRADVKGVPAPPAPVVPAPPAVPPATDPPSTTPPRPPATADGMRTGDPPVKVEVPPDDNAPPGSSTVIVVEPPKERQIVYRKPILRSVEVDFGAVLLAWDDDPGTNVEVSGYHVYRRLEGETEYTRVTQAPLTKKAYTDSSVEPKKSYEYAVAAVTKDAETILRLGLPPAGELKSEPKAVKTPGIFSIELKLVAQPAPEKGVTPEPFAQVVVRKQSKGSWKTKTVTVRKGDLLGDGEFATGWEVTEIVRVKVPRPDGSPGEIQTWQMQYKDDEGNAQKVVLLK